MAALNGTPMQLGSEQGCEGSVFFKTKMDFNKKIICTF